MNRPCNCGGDACIGQAVLLDGFQCVRATGLSTLNAASSIVDSDGPCHNCGYPCEVWFTNNSLWNQVNNGPTGLLCVRCFLAKAEAMGLNHIAWRVEND